MRILFVTSHLPFPPESGGRRREHELLLRVAREHSIELCVVSKTYEEDLANARALRDSCARIHVFPSAPAPSLDDGIAAQVARHRSSEATAHAHGRVLGGAVDAIHLEGFYLARHLPPSSPVPRLLSAQNVEYGLWEQKAGGGDEVHRQRMWAEAERTRQAEVSAWAGSQLCVASSPDDCGAIAEMLRRRGRPWPAVRLVPNGIDHVPRAGLGDGGEPEPEGGHIVFVGNFGYEPNVDAVIHLADEVMPRVSARRPGVKLTLVGTSPPSSVTRLAQRAGITVTGRVPAVEPYVAAADVVVCPLRFGGGVKFKMLEALRAGKAVVTTSVGAQGLPGVERVAMVADGAPQLAAAIVAVLEGPGLRSALASRAAAYAARLPTWDDAAAALLECYRELSDLGGRTHRHPGSRPGQLGQRQRRPSPAGPVTAGEPFDQRAQAVVPATRHQHDQAAPVSAEQGLGQQRPTPQPVAGLDHGRLPGPAPLHVLDDGVGDRDTVPAGPQDPPDGVGVLRRL